MLFLRGDFQKVWGKPRWMETIFNFLYCEKRKRLEPELRELKKDLFVKICSLDKCFFLEELTQEEIYRKCLKMIEEYFLHNENL